MHNPPPLTWEELQAITYARRVFVDWLEDEHMPALVPFTKIGLEREGWDIPPEAA